jgi:rubrerythrin
MLGGAGAVGAAAALGACGGKGGDGGTRTAASAAADRASDLKIVNYALTLEYVQANLYEEVLNSSVFKDRATAELAKVFGQAELQHVETLVATAESLGGPPAPKPKAHFAGTIATGPEAILMTAATVENLAAAAYLGQLPRIRSKEILATMLSIHSVEARHAAALNELAGRAFGGRGGLVGSLPDGAFGKPMDMDAVLQAVAPFVAG